MANVHIMGGSNVATNTDQINFSDGTIQTTAAVAGGGMTGGSSIIGDATGIIMSDPFGGLLTMNATAAGISAGGSGGGFNQFYNGTVWITVAADGNGNGLFLGPLFANQQINLSNSSGNAGMVVTTGDSNNVFGNPLFLGVSGGVGITISPFGIFLNGIALSLTPPTAGQVLTASSPTAAGWVTPAGGGATKTARVDMGTIASATPSLVTTYNWPTAFADNNYTVVGSVVIEETPPAGAATAIVCVGSIELLASGAGFNFVICNADGAPHHVIANFIAVHD